MESEWKDLIKQRGEGLDQIERVVIIVWGKSFGNKRWFGSFDFIVIEIF